MNTNFKNLLLGTAMSLALAHGPVLGSVAEVVGTSEEETEKPKLAMKDILERDKDQIISFSSPEDFMRFESNAEQMQQEHDWSLSSWVKTTEERDLFKDLEPLVDPSLNIDLQTCVENLKNLGWNGADEFMRSLTTIMDLKDFCTSNTLELEKEILELKKSNPLAAEKVAKEKDEETEELKSSKAAAEKLAIEKEAEIERLKATMATAEKLAIENEAEFTALKAALASSAERAEAQDEEIKRLRAAKLVELQERDIERLRATAEKLALKKEEETERLKAATIAAGKLVTEKDEEIEVLKAALANAQLLGEKFIEREIAWSTSTKDSLSASLANLKDSS